MNRFVFKTGFTVLSICLFVLIMSCSTKESSSENILALVDDKTITVDEFVRRAEYTIRPPYCNKNNRLHKKIVLNSLIAEKLLSLEAGDDNAFISSPEVQMQMSGRKEQAMRLVQFYEDVYDKVEPDSSEIKKYIANIGRKYKIAYFNVDDPSLARQYQVFLENKSKTFEEVHSLVSPLAAIPNRTVSFETYENDVILDSLFSKKLNVEQIIGPVEIEKNQYMFIKIIDWTHQPIMTDKALQEKWKQVDDRLRLRDSSIAYKEFVANVMKGKQIEFEPKTFKKVVNLMGPVYFIPAEKKKELTKNAIFKTGDEETNFTEFQSELKKLYGAPLFKINNDIWTVEDFVRELNSHPLVFRDKSIKPQQFGKQMQLAIGDLVRDKYLTEQAYKKGYDKKPYVTHTVNMWQDHTNYMYQKTQYLKSLNADSLLLRQSVKVIDIYLNSYVDSLQTVYSDLIQIDLNKFDQIQLTNIDMSVIQKNVPYSKPVPGFPLITTDARFDYGQLMEEKEK